MTLKEYQEKVDAWIQTYGMRYFDIKTNALLLSEEVGEYNRLVARIYGEQSFKAQPDSDPKKLLADEMADIIFVTTCMANQLGIDLEEAIGRNFNKKTKRDKERHQNNKKLQ